MKSLLRSKVKTEDIEIAMDILDEDNSGDITLKEFKSILKDYFKENPYQVRKKREKQQQKVEFQIEEDVNVKVEWKFFVDSFYEFYYQVPYTEDVQIQDILFDQEINQLGELMLQNLVLPAMQTGAMAQL